MFVIVITSNASVSLIKKTLSIKIIVKCTTRQGYRVTQRLLIERRLRRDLPFSNQQYGFMPGKSTTDALFALRVLMEKYREGPKELHCVFVDLEKAYDKVPI